MCRGLASFASSRRPMCSPTLVDLEERGLRCRSCPPGLDFLGLQNPKHCQADALHLLTPTCKFTASLRKKRVSRQAPQSQDITALTGPTSPVAFAQARSLRDACARIQYPFGLHGKDGHKRSQGQGQGQSEHTVSTRKSQTWRETE